MTTLRFQDGLAEMFFSYILLCMSKSQIFFRRIPPGRIFLGVVWGFLCVVGLGYYSFLQMEQQRWRLEQLGWAAYFKSQGTAAFYWRCLNDSTCADVLTKKVLDNTSLSVFILALTLGLGITLRPERYQPKRTLTQRWAGLDDIQPLIERRGPKEIIDSGCKGVDPPMAGYLGVWEDPQHPKKRYFLRPTRQINNVHSLTYAGTGGGKTVGSFRPRIALDAAEGNIAVVLDTKYPNPNDSYLDMRDYFRAFGRHVTIINPFEKEVGIQIPILADVRGYDQALDIARLIYPPDLEQGEDPGAKVYTSNARLLLAGIIYGLSLGPREKRNFGEVYQVANIGMEGVRQWFASRKPAQREIRSVLETDKKVFSGAINRLVEDMTIFRMDSAIETFSPGPREIDLDKMLVTPGMIHLVLPESYIRGSSGRAILRFFKRYLDGRMLALAEKLGKPLPVHINYYYDEFALFGFLPNLNDDLATLRSRNISLHMALQNRSQAMNIYGEIGWSATVDNNIGTTIILPGSFTQNDAKYWSETLGETSIEQYSIGETQAPGEVFKKVSKSLRVDEKKTALINIDELQRMQVGELIALVRGFPPIRLRSYPIEWSESQGNPIAWIHDTVRTWKNAHLRHAIQGNWLKEALRVVEKSHSVHQPDDPSSSDEQTPSQALVSLSSEEVQQAFADWMTRLVEERVEVKAVGRPGQIRKYLVTETLVLAPLDPTLLKALVAQGYLRKRNNTYWIDPKKCPWGQEMLNDWERSAYINYIADPGMA